MVYLLCAHYQMKSTSIELFGGAKHMQKLLFYKQFYRLISKGSIVAMKRTNSVTSIALYLSNVTLQFINRTSVLATLSLYYASIRRAYPAARDPNALVQEHSGLNQPRYRSRPLDRKEAVVLDQLSVDHNLAAFADQPLVVLPGDTLLAGRPTLTSRKMNRSAGGLTSPSRSKLTFSFLLIRLPQLELRQNSICLLDYPAFLGNLQSQPGNHLLGTLLLLR
jgi:hypothetical protein